MRNAPLGSGLSHQQSKPGKRKQPIEIGQTNSAVGTAAADQTWRREGATRSPVEHGGCYRPRFEEYHTYVGSVAALLELLTLGPQN